MAQGTQKKEIEKGRIRERKIEKRHKRKREKSHINERDVERVTCNKHI